MQHSNYQIGQLPVTIYKADQRVMKTHRPLQWLTILDCPEVAFNEVEDRLVLSELFLEPKELVNKQVITIGAQLLLPIIGGIELSVDQVKDMFLGAGQYLYLPSQENPNFLNSYEANEVNLIAINFPKQFSLPKNIAIGNIQFAFENQLETLIESNEIRVSIGKFSGRGELSFQTDAQLSSLFCWVIRGAFEVNGRLLHPKDALNLPTETWIEMEALSEHSIMLVIEQKH